MRKKQREKLEYDMHTQPIFAIAAGALGPFLSHGWYHTREEAIAVCEAVFHHYRNKVNEKTGKPVPASHANWHVIELKPHTMERICAFNLNEIQSVQFGRGERVCRECSLMIAKRKTNRLEYE